MSDFHVLEKVKYSDGRIGVKVLFHLPSPATVGKSGKPVKDSFLDDKQSNKISLASKLSNIPPEDQIKLDFAEMLEYEYTLLLKEDDLDSMDLTDLKLKLKLKYDEVMSKAYKSLEHRYDLWDYNDDIITITKI